MKKITTKNNQILKKCKNMEIFENFLKRAVMYKAHYPSA